MWSGGGSRGGVRRAVEAGLVRRTLEKSDVQAVGLDEKSFLRGNRCATILYSHDIKCVFEVVEGRSAAAGKAVLQRAIPEALRGEVKAVSTDLSAPYAKAVREELPNARIVADRFHIAKRFSKAIDQVRRQELSTLPVARRDVLKKRAFCGSKTTAICAKPKSPVTTPLSGLISRPPPPGIFAKPSNISSSAPPVRQPSIISAYGSLEYIKAPFLP